MNQFFASTGIIHQTTCIETPQQNGIVEHKHQHLLNVTRALLFQSYLPPTFWSFALLHATFIINCFPTPFLKNKTPYELLYTHLFDLSSLKVFGCLCYISTITVTIGILNSSMLTMLFSMAFFMRRFTCNFLRVSLLHSLDRFVVFKNLFMV
uniref:Copia protein n=1 Tax=Cajanus cajan TaxID=3821 RepID=A0A151RF63_CAJCA|nr:Copia protein [Cajanus cajan]